MRSGSSAGCPGVVGPIPRPVSMSPGRLYALVRELSRSFLAAPDRASGNSSSLSQRLRHGLTLLEGQRFASSILEMAGHRGRVQ